MMKGLMLIIPILLLSVCIENGVKEESMFEIREVDRFYEKRRLMVERDLKGRDITDERVLSAMLRIPRHKFVPKELENEAYADHPLPIGYGQTISQPYIVALMTQALELNGSEKVLEIGTGSGYQAAVLAELSKEVYSVEIIEPLAIRANETLKSLGYDVNIKAGDGYFGWEENAPYDAIIVTCAVDHVPPALIEQLKENGRLIIPLGSVRYYQTLTLIKKINNTLRTEYITSVRFVPMLGEAMKRSDG
ncbi:MAG: protein-L-isoaspartate O-methyltransferase [Candidatus Altiarchaeales archaeon]|nr:MAG: protein-L-isoaspartate O-methyltransferase [Candidatus Altiarchaeales archaeon]RLI94956.1 MAG: protein-L-isoaspartate O-methyltransferase [Candidatus Altiarchaeales archaeon]HDO82338.1 protein-L-isoaspartate(D-aspartate) O-methyltransferase [Candidatus Altiarchaeales archaeon]HEX54987.1 protein-L-isoaspartate(D-aspartate) O-methyltransferase [Candidatus Altiarchaeales archaeon]